MGYLVTPNCLSFPPQILRSSSQNYPWLLLCGFHHLYKPCSVVEIIQAAPYKTILVTILFKPCWCCQGSRQIGIYYTKSYRSPIPDQFVTTLLTWLKDQGKNCVHVLFRESIPGLAVSAQRALFCIHRKVKLIIPTTNPLTLIPYLSPFSALLPVPLSLSLPATSQDPQVQK